jgi:hypothetical protein
MPAPFITGFGDNSHEEGESGLTVDGFHFGFWVGELWMFAAADRSGAADQLTVTTWGERQLTGGGIPAAPNNVPGTVYLARKTTNNQWSSPAFPWSFTLVAAGAKTAAITGTAGDGITELEIVEGGETIIITLTNETWVSGAAFNDAVRQAIIDGLDSDGSEPNGWNAEVRDKEVVGAVVRDSDTQVTITLTAAPAYSVLADETITVTVPASAIVGAAPITATPTILASATAGNYIWYARRRSRR